MHILERLKNWKTTLEGCVWGAVVVGLVHYLFTQAGCNFSAINWQVFALGAIPVIRGAMALDPAKPA